jgi:myo-inositol-1(or 4)-monophosphatase
MLISGFPYDVWTSPNDNTSEWRYFTKRAASMRCNGSAALDLCCIACGRADGYWERGNKVWDVAAGSLIVREAGGRATDYQGNDDFIYSQQVVAANPQLHAQLLAGLREVGWPAKR